MALRHYTLDFKLSAAADSASTVPDLLSIFHEQEMTETVHETNGHGYLGTFVGKNGRLAVVRVHSHGLITIDLQCYEEDNTEQTDNLLSALETKLKIILNSNITRIKRLPALVRGAEVDRYWPTIDDRLMEYDFDQLVYEEDSAYQNIKIFHSQQFGNVLMLKDDTSTSESDLAYAQAIMGNGREKFAGKEVLILGGGDGGTLNEVVKQKPKMVTMLDIDQRVIDVSRKYMRGTCGDILDNLKGDCYQKLEGEVGGFFSSPALQTVVEDAVPVLKKYVQEGKMFDYVLNELTEVPTSREEKESKWDFLRLTLDLSIKVLHPSGKYITAVDAANRTKQLGLYEEELGKLSCPLGFSKEVACVPSFLELWVFYTVWKI